MTVANYYIVTKTAWFAVGTEGERKIHAITDRCIPALKDFLRYMGGQAQITVWPNLPSVAVVESDQSKYCADCWKTNSPAQLAVMN